MTFTLESIVYYDLNILRKNVTDSCKQVAKTFAWHTCSPLYFWIRMSAAQITWKKTKQRNHEIRCDNMHKSQRPFWIYY